jgi:hypothetical protein
MSLSTWFIAVLLTITVPTFPAYAAQAGAIRLGATATMIIGAKPVTSSDELLDVIAATKLTDGRIAIGDRGLYQIRVYDRHGRLLGKQGQRGQGPGDFMNLTRLWSGPHDSIYAYDFSQKRVSVFTPSGKFARTWPMIEANSRTFIDGAFSDGSLLAELDIQPPEPSQTGIERRFKRLARVRSDGKVVDTIPQLFLRGETFVFVGAKGPIGTARAPMSRFGHTFLHNDAIYFGDGEEFVIRKLDRSGKPVRTFQKPTEPLTLGQQERTQIVNEITRHPRMSASFSGMLKVELEKFLEEGKLAQFDSMLVDRSGRVWARESRGVTAAARTWTVFDSTGRVLGRVPINAELTVLEIGADYVLTTGSSELGYTVVTEYPLLVSAPGRRQ